MKQYTTGFIPVFSANSFQLFALMEGGSFTIAKVDNNWVDTFMQFNATYSVEKALTVANQLFAAHALDYKPELKVGDKFLHVNNNCSEVYTAKTIVGNFVDNEECGGRTVLNRSIPLPQELFEELY
jgi:hypothetical protein